MLCGLITGDLIYLSLAVFGLALLAQSFASLFMVIRVFSIVFLLYLAWQFWRAEHVDLGLQQVRARDLASSWISGLATTLGNPKTIAFYLALMPIVIDLESITLGIWATRLVPLTILVLLLVGGIYVLGAVSIRRLLSGASAQRRMYRSAAVMMAAAAGSLAFKGH